GLVGLNRDVVAAAGDGSSGQRGFYLFHDGVLSQAGNLNLPVPSGTGSFTDVTAASFSEGNLAFKGFGSAGEIGIYLFADGLLSRVADLNTPIPGGIGTFTTYDLADLSGENLTFQGAGGGQHGIYLARPGHTLTIVTGPSGSPNPVASGETTVL